MFPIPPGEEQGLKNLLNRIRSGELHGLNVTIPHKQNVIPLLDELTQTAQVIGAVNTIYSCNDKLIGDNTDAPGFLSDLQHLLGEQRSSIVNRPSSIVLGAGGSAHAVVYALLHNGWHVTIAARRREQSKQLADWFTNYQLQTTDFTLSNFELSNIALIVNTTPLGMTPNVDQSPWPENLSFPQNAAIYDLVYNPHVTKLVRDAHAHGSNATTGLGMLIEQAALAFEIWTGHHPSREMMRAALPEQFPIINQRVF